MELALSFMSFFMLIINLTLLHRLSKARFSGLRTLLVYFAYTVVVVVTERAVFGAPGDLNQSVGISILTGFLYLLPVRFLYDQPFLQSLHLVFSSWAYCMFGFVAALQIGYLAPGGWYWPTAAAAQLIIYAITFAQFIGFTRDKLWPMVKNADDKAVRYLNGLCFCWLATAMALNFSFSYPDVILLNLLVLALTMVAAVLSYQLIYETAVYTQEEKRLKLIIYLDNLTGLKNRSGLMVEGEALIAAGTPFDLAFLDLDQFKSVNDQFGHLAGDQYLCAFVKTFESLLTDGETLYRMAGDEFICLCGPGRGAVLAEEALLLGGRFAGPCAFLGVSVGTAGFPADGGGLEALIAAADQRMYKQKGHRAQEQRTD